MELGILAELLIPGRKPELISEMKTGICRALLTLICKCLSG